MAKYNDVGILVVPQTLEVQSIMEHVKHAIEAIEENEPEMALSWLKTIAPGGAIDFEITNKYWGKK